MRTLTPMTTFCGAPRRRQWLLGALGTWAGLAWGSPEVASVPTEPAVVGTSLPARTMLDANAHAVHLDASVQAVVFTADKQASAWVHPVLAEWGAVALAQHRVIVLADISAMPALITRMFALPKLRELPFSLGLVQDAAQTADLPRQPGQATLIQLKGLDVTDIRFLPDAAALQAALQALPPAVQP